MYKTSEHFTCTDIFKEAGENMHTYNHPENTFALSAFYVLFTV